MNEQINLLDINNLSVLYKTEKGNVRAVDSVTLSIDKGESLGIVGESGSGKTTLIMALLRLLPKTALIEGEAIFKGKNIFELKEKKLKDLRWQEISIVFQKAMSSFSPLHKIGKQLTDVYNVHNKNCPKDETIKRIKYLFKLMNLSDRVYDLYPHELSGGMLKRVAIAMSLLNNPSLVILDEATVGLDVVTQGQILKEIRKLEEEIGITSLIITHDVSVVAENCKKVAVMYAGRLMETGYVKDVFTKPTHPYTKALLQSYPSLKGENQKLHGIKGSLPDLSKNHIGCIFAPRCTIAKEKCFKFKPELKSVKEKQEAACFFAGGEINE